MAAARVSIRYQALLPSFPMRLPDFLRVAWYGGKDLSFAGKFRWFRQFCAWKRKMRREKLQPVAKPLFTAILLSYKRPQNIRPILQSLLKTPEIGKVIVSNNNSRIRMGDWLSCSDPRVTVIDQVIDRPAGLRQHIAYREHADFFLIVDDDLFLLPSQLSGLCRALIEDPAVPHGIAGQLYDSWMDRMHRHVVDHNGPVDIVNGAVAFTRKHLAEYFRLLDLLQIGPTHPFSTACISDDIILSWSGTRKPRIHALGPMTECPTSADPRIAVWRREGFFGARIMLLLTLRKLRPLV